MEGLTFRIHTAHITAKAKRMGLQHFYLQVHIKMNTHTDSHATNNDKFARLKAIASGEITAPILSSEIRFWTHEP
jgi:hypothetical protein